MLVGTVRLGAVVSTTVTVNVVVAVLPAASAAVQLTVVVPMGKTLPEAGVHETETLPPTMSMAVGFWYDTVAPPSVLPSIPAMLGAAPKTGAFVSTTVTVNDFCVLFALWSV